MRRGGVREGRGASPHHPIACLQGIAPLNESRPRVNMPLGCQSIPVTCNTNTQNLLSYKINVLLVPPCIALAKSHRSPLKSSAAHVWQIMVKWSESLGYSAGQVCCLYDFKVIAWYQMSKYFKNWKMRHKHYWKTHQPNINIPLSRFGLLTNSVLGSQHRQWVPEVKTGKCMTLGPNFIPYILNHECSFSFFAGLKLYLLCIQQSKKNNCTTPQGWQRKSFCRPLKSVLLFCPGLVQFVTWKSFNNSSLFHW